MCRINFARTLDLSPREAILVVYLASLSEDHRRELVLGEDEMTPAQTQLLVEAELVRHAIDMSYFIPDDGPSGEPNDEPDIA